MPTPRSVRPPWLLLVGVSALLGGTCNLSRAQAQSLPKVLLWGFQRGCEVDTELTNKVRDQLAKRLETTVAIRQLASAKGLLPACSGSVTEMGKGCYQTFKDSCQPEGGLLLGGLISPTEVKSTLPSGPAGSTREPPKAKGPTRIRLWLWDVKTGKVAVQDDYCQACDPDLSKVVTAHAEGLLNMYSFSAATSLAPRPLFCTSTEAPPAAADTAGALIVGFSSDGGKLLRPALIKSLTSRRAATSPPQVDTVNASANALIQKAQQQAAAQALHVQIIDPKSVHLTLWDRQSKRTSERWLTCQKSCEENPTQVLDSAAALLDVCFADRCASLQLGDRRPPAACEPFPAETCAELAISPGARGPRAIDPTVAKWIEGLTGASVGLSLATAVALAAADSSYERVSNGVTLKHELRIPALTAGGIAIGLTGLAVPIFYFVETAKRRPASGVVVPAAPLLMCPPLEPPTARSAP